MEKIEKKVFEFISQNSLIKNGDKLLLAISGGADSVCLLKLLIALKNRKTLKDINFHILHVNHKLRGKFSVDDQQYVKKLADKSALPITVKQADVSKYARENKISLETAGRQIRLNIYAETFKKHNCSGVVTAHHKDDNSETVIARLLRGTGFKGLAGIRPKTIINDMLVIRPLLCISRDEIEDYLNSKNIKWQTDHTNTDCRFTRNHIRHKLVPYLQNQSEYPICDSLFELSQNCVKLFGKIEAKAKKTSLEIEEFKNYHPLIQVEIIQNLLAANNIGLQKFSQKHYKKIIEFIKSPKPTALSNLPSGAIIYKTDNRFFLKTKAKPAKKRQSAELVIDGQINFGKYKITAKILSADSTFVEKIKNNKDKNIEWFGYEKIAGQSLIARERQIGDKFVPFGSRTAKKVGKFITASGISTAKKKDCFVICCGKKILWLTPLRRSNWGAITDQTKTILQIQLNTK